MQKDEWMIIHYRDSPEKPFIFYDKMVHNPEEFMFHSDCKVIEVFRNVVIIKPGVYK